MRRFVLQLMHFAPQIMLFAALLAFFLAFARITGKARPWEGDLPSLARLLADPAFSFERGLLLGAGAATLASLGMLGWRLLMIGDL